MHLAKTIIFISLGVFVAVCAALDHEVLMGSQKARACAQALGRKPTRILLLFIGLAIIYLGVSAS